MALISPAVCSPELCVAVDILDIANCWSYFICMCRIIYHLRRNQPALPSILQVSESSAEYIKASSLCHYSPSLSQRQLENKPEPEAWEEEIGVSHQHGAKGTTTGVRALLEDHLRVNQIRPGQLCPQKCVDVGGMLNQTLWDILQEQLWQDSLRICD